MNGAARDHVTALMVAEHEDTPEFVVELARNARYRPLGRVMSVPAAVDAVRRLAPDIVVAEVVSAERMAELVDLSRRAATVVVSTLPPEAALLPCMAGGARGFVWKPVEAGVLDHAVATVAAGHLYLDPRSTEWLVGLALHQYAAEKECGLTMRQSQVLQFVRVGLTNREIAETLGLSIDTVKTHLQEAMRRLGVHDRRDAAARVEGAMGQQAGGPGRSRALVSTVGLDAARSVRLVRGQQA